MKVINLDKFRIVTAVELDGVSYTVEGRTVEDFLNNDIDARMEACQSEKERVLLLVSELEKISTIPKEVLLKQHFPVLQALMHIVSGNDPESQTVRSNEAQVSGNAGK